MKTAVVILNWNTEGFLREFLPGLLRSVEKIDGAEVIVADNASTDGSLKVMKDEFPDVRTIAFEKNFGFTGGYNKAFAQIDSDLFVLINSDIEVTEGWLEPLIRWMEAHPECGACAPKLHSWQERGKFEYAGAAGGYLDRVGFPFCRGRIMSRLEEDKGQYDEPKDVFWATGACLMVRSEVYRRLGGLDERFFAHMEEIDLCWRLSSRGYRLRCIPSSILYHVGGGTLDASNPRKTFLNFRNNLCMIYKNAVDANKILFIRFFLDYMAAAVYLLKGETGNVKAVWKARREFSKMKTELKKDRDENLRKTVCKPSGLMDFSIIVQTKLRGKKTYDELD